MDLSPGALILVTGVTGHVASHLALQILSSSSQFRVLGTTRSAAKGDFLQQLFRAKGLGPDRFAYVVVDNMEEEAAWDKIFEGKGIEGVAHVASPFAFGKDLDPETLILPAVNGTLAVLKSAAKYGVKRVVVTGSLAAVWLNDKPIGATLDESDWNIVSPAIVADPSHPGRGYHAYFASKTASEKAAWAFMGEQQPSFTLAVVLPCHILGPPIHRIPSLLSLTSGLRRLHGLANGSITVPRPDAPLYNFVDVRDVARLHLLLLTLPTPFPPHPSTAANGRYIASAGSYTLSETARILKRLYPEKPVAEPSEEEEDLIRREKRYLSNARASSIPGMGWTGLEECVGDTARAVFELEAKVWDQ